MHPVAVNKSAASQQWMSTRVAGSMSERRRLVSVAAALPEAAGTGPKRPTPDRLQPAQRSTA